MLLPEPQDYLKTHKRDLLLENLNLHRANYAVTGQPILFIFSNFLCRVVPDYTSHGTHCKLDTRYLSQRSCTLG